MRLLTTMSHDGFASKEQSVGRTESGGLETLDFKARNRIPGDDFPDFFVPIAVVAAAGKRNREVTPQRHHVKCATQFRAQWIIK